MTITMTMTMMTLTQILFAFLATSSTKSNAIKGRLQWPATKHSWHPRWNFNWRPLTIKGLFDYKLYGITAPCSWDLKIWVWLWIQDFIFAVSVHASDCDDVMLVWKTCCLHLDDNEFCSKTCTEEYEFWVMCFNQKSWPFIIKHSIQFPLMTFLSSYDKQAIQI